MVTNTAADMFLDIQNIILEKTVFYHVEDIYGLLILLKNKGLTIYLL